MRFGNRDKASENEQPNQWRAQTQKPEHGFFCRQCNGSGLVPVCVPDKHRNQVSMRSATCECQAGRHIAECNEHDGGKNMRIEDARRLDLVPPQATGFSTYWLHAKLTEARHDMIRLGDNDDWMVRYLEFALTLRDVENQSGPLFDWIAKNPKPGPKPPANRIARKVMFEAMEPKGEPDATRP